MKKLLLFLLFVSGAVNAQIVNIPDENFKYWLLWNADETGVTKINGVIAPVDANDDGEIQESEAAAITELYVSMPIMNIGSMVGIQAFTNLKILECGQQAFTALDLSGMASLERVSCSTISVGLLTSINITGCTNLETLDVSGNGISSLDMSTCPVLTKLYNNWSYWTGELDLTSGTALEEIELGSTGAGSVKVSGLPNLHSLYFISDGGITGIDISNCPLMTQLYYNGVSDGLLTAVNFTNCPALEEVNIQNCNALTSLPLTNCPGLHSLKIQNCGFSSLDLSVLPALNNLELASNNFTTIDLSVSPLLQMVDLSWNDLVTVDASACTGLAFLSVDGNPIESLFIKNGSDESISIGNAPNLHYICADESQIAAILNFMDMFNITGIVVNSYCSFNPGGNFNTISGTFTLDANNNGCDGLDGGFSLATILVDNGTATGGTTSDMSGNYAYYMGAGNYTVTPQLENPSWFTVTPPNAVVNFADANNNTNTQNFCVAPNGVHNDVDVVIVPIAPARPGFDATYQLVYKNKGNQAISGSVNFGYEDDVLDFVSATITPDAQATGMLTWNYTDLLPFETRSFNLTLNVNSPMETPAVNNGDLLDFTSTITPTAGDETAPDNTFAFIQTVVGSFDPNDKTCLEGDVVTPEKIGDYLHYNINFENTGTFAAENIVVKDDIDPAMFDIATLQVLEASHPVVARVTGNKVEFIFENINLGENEHGNIVFKIRTGNALEAGSMVSNKANIFFDYNFPIETNEAITMFPILGNPDNGFSNSISVYPNPANRIVNVKSPEFIKSIEVYDAAGRIVAVHLAGGNETALDVAAFSNGIYYLKVATEHGIDIKKLIKE